MSVLFKLFGKDIEMGGLEGLKNVNPRSRMQMQGRQGRVHRGGSRGNGSGVTVFGPANFSKLGCKVEEGDSRQVRANKARRTACWDMARKYGGESRKRRRAMAFAFVRNLRKGAVAIRAYKEAMEVQS